MYKILLNTFICGFFGGVFSYFASLYDTNPEYIKVTAFLWGLPLLYFILLNIAWANGKATMIAFNKHAIIGTSISVLVMILTFYIYEIGRFNVVILQSVILFSSIYFYLNFKLYNS
jgi:predicted signal transduction protein with EAL and GGDEF domain